MLWPVLICTSLFTIAQARQPPKATVENGTYVGIHNSHYNVDYFLGIPFAQPPVGDLRLAPPAPLNLSFSGTRNATKMQPACVQFLVCGEYIVNAKWVAGLTSTGGDHRSSDI